MIGEKWEEGDQSVLIGLDFLVFSLKTQALGTPLSLGHSRTVSHSKSGQTSDKAASHPDRTWRSSLTGHFKNKKTPIIQHKGSLV